MHYTASERLDLFSLPHASQVTWSLRLTNDRTKRMIRSGYGRDPKLGGKIRFSIVDQTREVYATRTTIIN